MCLTCIYQLFRTSSRMDGLIIYWSREKLVCWNNCSNKYINWDNNLVTSSLANWQVYMVSSMSKHVDLFKSIMYMFLLPLPLSCRSPFSCSLPTTASQQLVKSSDVLEMECNSILPSVFTATKWSSTTWFSSTQSLIKLHLNLKKYAAKYQNNVI